MVRLMIDIVAEAKDDILMQKRALEVAGQLARRKLALLQPVDSAPSAAAAATQLSHKAELSAPQTFTSMITAFPQVERVVGRLLYLALKTQADPTLVESVLSLLTELLVFDARTVDAFSLWRTIQTAGPELRHQLLEVTQTVLEGDAEVDLYRRHVFVMRGQHAGIIAPSSTALPLKKGYTFCASILVDATTPAMAMYSFRGENGHGVSAAIDGDSLVLASFTSHGSFINLPVPLNGRRIAMHQTWTHVAIVHAKKMVFKDKILVYLDGQLHFAGNLPYPDALQMAGGHNCVGATPQFPSFQGQMVDPTLLGTALSDAEVAAVAPCSHPPTAIMQQWLWENGSAADKSKFVFAYDARVCTRESICDDVSGHSANGWLEPGTRSLCRSSLAAALGPLGGAATYLLLLFDPTVSPQDAVRVLRLVASGLVVSRRCRSQFLRWHGSKVIAHLLTLLPTPALTEDLLDAVVAVVDAVAPHVQTSRLRTMVLALFALQPVWFHSPVACQVRLLESVLPTYLRLLHSNNESDSSVMTMDVSHWCELMATWYSGSSAAVAQAVDASMCCKLVLDNLIDPLLFPKQNVLDESDGWDALIRHLDMRMQSIRQSQTTAYDVQEIFGYFTRTLSSGQEMMPGVSSPPSRKLLFKLEKHSPMALWYTWLATPALELRLRVLEAFSAMTSHVHLRFPDAVLFHHALSSPLTIDMRQCAVILDVCLGPRSSALTGARHTSTPRGHFVPVVLLKLLACSSVVDYRVQLYTLYELHTVLRGPNSDIFKEYIRVDPEWMKTLVLIQAKPHLVTCIDSMQATDPPGLDTRQLNDYCMMLCDETAAVDTRVRIVQSIGAAQDKAGADFMLTVLHQASAPGPVKQAIIHTVISSFPEHAAHLVEALCSDMIVDILVYSLRQVNHGWIHVLETYFYLYKSPQRCVSLYTAVADAMLCTPVDKALQWENVSQFCSLLALLYFIADRMHAPLGDESKHVALLQKARDLWLPVLPRLPVVAWAVDGGQDRDVLHELFATYPLTRRLALYTMFQTIKVSLLTTGTASADVGRLRTAFETLHVVSVVADDDQVVEPTMQPLFLLSVVTELHGLWALATAVEDKATLTDLIHSVALEALGRVGPDSELAHALMGLTALPADTSAALWVPCMQVVSKYAVEAQHEVDSHVDRFVAKWKHLVETNAVFNVAMTMQDVDQRTVILSVHTQDVMLLREKNEDGEGGAVDRLQHMTERAAADAKAAAKRFQTQLERCLEPVVPDVSRQQKVVPSSPRAFKLSTSENLSRMRLALKVVEPLPYLEPHDVELDHTATPSLAASMNAMASSWRSDSGVQGLADMLSDANVRAVLRTATSSNVEDDTLTFDEMLDEDNDDNNPQTLADASSSSSSGSLVGRTSALPPPSPFKSATSATNVTNPKRKSSAAGFPTKSNSTDFVCPAHLVRQMYIMVGQVHMTESEFVFYPHAIVDEHDQDIDQRAHNQTSSLVTSPSDEAKLLRPRRLRLDDMCHIYSRRYLLKLTALEIFVASTRKNYFFHFASTSIHDVHSALISRRPARLVANPDWRRLHRHPSHAFRSADHTSLWVNHEISTFEYLMWLNTVSGRTYNDLTQYPVFPWVLADYTSPTLDLSRASTFRDLSKPMGALDAARLEFFKDRYAAFDDPDIPKFMYGSHYSHVGAVLYYLVRLEPFTSLARRVQGGRFDHADRLFHSVADTWANCLTDTSDLKELTPEWFYSTAFLTNHNHVDLGTRQNGVKLDDVVLPPYATSPQHFIALHMQALESEYVSQHLHLWIDLVFGDKQRGPAALEAHNVFFYLTYEGLVDIDAITDPVLQASMRAQIAHFGQTPSQLLREPHVARHIPDTLPPGGLVPLLLPHVHPIALVEFVSVTALLCLDTTGMLSMQKFTSPYKTATRQQALPAASTSSSSGALSPQRAGPSSGVDAILELVDRKPHRVLPDYAWLRGDFVWTAVGAAVASGGHPDGSVRCYAISDGAFLGSVLHHATRVTCLAQHRNTDLVCGSADGTISAWTMLPSSGWTSSLLDTLNIFKPITKRIVVEPDYSPRQAYLGHASPITALAVRNDLDVVVSGSAERCLVHSMSTGALLVDLALPPRSTNVHAVAVCTVGWIVVSVSATSDTGGDRTLSTLRSYSLQGELLATTTSTELPVTKLVPFSRTAHVVAAGPMGANVVAVHSMMEVQPLTTVGVSSAALSVDEKVAIVGLDVMPAQLLAIAMGI
ncbi:hypothetical protein DYB26_001542 [Aphanomyces astaci]|uniref:BEACH domain-containing protein n=1 Tax=Aphanomyces astaci TaxID=112090 RepID=A0A3R7BKA2_APHAT|nr:hypothetical protein DYB26_001542 [Aphanomyces astaci]